MTKLLGVALMNIAEWLYTAAHKTWLAGFNLTYRIPRVE